MNQFELEYQRWLAYPQIDEEIFTELHNISQDKSAIQDRFYRNLAFGTGGLRGVLGGGTNRMNIYTVRRATHGLAAFLLNNFPAPSVAIAYDSRIKSDVFAYEAACIFAFHGIHVHIYRELMPTPTLSFAIRELGCDAGIVITASHNPATYNGYKVYNHSGCQITLDTANLILAEIERTDIFAPCAALTFDELIKLGKITYISDNITERYFDAVQRQQLNIVDQSKKLHVVYSPLNGSGLRCVTEILYRIGISNLTVVSSQKEPDGRFPTCPFPNPEEESALQEGLLLCKQTGADLLIATDPDCDRVGAAVRTTDGSYELISGNEMGAMLFEYICMMRLKNGTMPQHPVAIKTIVTTALAEKIAQKYQVKLINVLTGFKFIGEQIGAMEQQGCAENYIFGFEESCGYLAGTYVRDKDAVSASMLICEMAAYYWNQGLSLLDIRELSYNEYGYYQHILDSFVFEGVAGCSHMAQMMHDLRNNQPTHIGSIRVLSVTDYAEVQEGSILPSADVLQFDLADESKVIIRPSGTEPKLKLYIISTGATNTQATQRSNILSVAMKEYMLAHNI